MNNYQKIFVIIIAIAIAAFLLLFSWSETKIVFGQPPSAEKPIKSMTDKKPKKSDIEKTDDGKFKTAAVSNAGLKNSLKWTFGNKQQTGWNLYVPLIRHTINTENDADSTGFAFALSVWQKENSLVSNGILDAETLSALIKKWQSRRIPKIYEADEKLFFNAPITDFFDPTRDVNLLNVEKETYSAYKKMCAAAAKDLGLKFEKGNLTDKDNFLKIISAHRSRAYQEQLRNKEPNAGRAQLAFNSPHFTGRALDIYVGGEPVTTKDANRAIQIETKVYQWLVKNAERFGFYPYFYEPWHWEYVPENKKSDRDSG
ncbi:MAG: M15 family metallopeptidase [Pyrinomonadaceae bacterium]